MKLTENFSLDEFASKDGSPFPDNIIPNIQRLAENLQVIRDEIGRPITINSGYRSLLHNLSIGGKPNSKHLDGIAADFVIEGISPKFVANIIEKLIAEKRIREGGLKAYDNFTHYDIRGIKARW